MNVLTIKGFEDLNDIKYDGTTNDVNSIALISGKSTEYVKKMKPTAYSELKSELLTQSANGANPVYLVKYKDTIYGYHPAEIGTIEDLGAIEVLSAGKKWQALAAVLFRPVKPLSKWAHRKNKRWTDAYGIKVKYINNYKADMLCYQCKDVDLSTMDLDYWNDFPWTILMGNLNFLVGSGTKLSLSIQPASLKSPVIRKEMEILNNNLMTALAGSMLHTIWPKLMYLSSTEGRELLTLHHAKLSSGLLDKEGKLVKQNLKDKVSENAWVLTGKDCNTLIDGVFELYSSLFTKKDLDINQLLGLCGLMKANKYNNRAIWLGLT